MNDMWIFLLIFAGVGLVLLVVGWIIRIANQRKKKRCTYETTGVMVDFVKHRSLEDYNTCNFGIYEYQYMGQTYRKQANSGSSAIPEIGKKKTIYVNPENPEECIIKSWVETFIFILFTIIGLLFIIIGIVVYCCAK